MLNNSHQNTDQLQGSDMPDGLDGVKISDEDLDADDNVKKIDSKEAKKRAKRLRSSEEKKQFKRRNTLIVFGSVLLVLVTLFAITATRWSILNALGFRGNLTVLVQDQKTNETISEVNVVLDGVVVGSTDLSGQLSVDNVRLGERIVGLEKPGYSRTLKKIKIGFGVTKYDSVIEAIGIKINISVKNWLSQKSISKAVLTTKVDKVITDAKGQAVLIVPPSEEKVALKIKAGGYLDREVELDTKVTSRDVTLISSAKDYFISKRDGKFDIFSSNIDGTNQKKIIEATGKESQNFLQFSVGRSNKKAILVANREGKRLNNRIVAGVYMVDLQGATIEKVDEGSDIHLIDWVGDTVFYTKTAPELNYDDKKFTRIMGYGLESGNLSTRAQATYFQLASVVGSKLFYKPDGDADLTSLDISSGAKRVYLRGKQISYGVQADYGALQLETLDSVFYEMNSLDGSTIKIDRQPGSAQKYALSQDGNRLAYVIQRDGKGVLMTRTLKDSKSTMVEKIGGMIEPVRWVSPNLVVARVVTSQETSDYVIDVSQGKFAKIVDVSNVGQGLY